MAHHVLDLLIILLSLVGLWDAIYFTLAYYGRVKSARWVPEVLCAREGSSCVTVVKTEYARVFGWPNSLFGIGYYLILILWRVAPTSWLTFLGADLHGLLFLLRLLLTGASLVTVVLGIYLVYALRAKLHVDCPLCYLAHAINTALFVLVILAAW